ncbi:colanic acid biosynthesis glycosyltransferase WcaL [Dulcicalothrix desertica PCC 7102]|uniref:Colanic acid biosynthesis glycosyltransferase WcaL n=1 Tax=Dulcicalothrix desertica PCC 7102 TaxID=232991 RepID=A0A3S1CTA9_9CYAN|nr:glycosyltransferase family 4 protein [Dulcicalothrix desertica]RUT08269.1 colanic acid biosynthesis glycosyltransferase WcaL [Dulcicalothrix desertica PCC 7102]TWH40136.1 glycosyltransferase involved in cell wall biosynthesis [Dulcicalothrix desertica PCC 7102]
MRIGYLIPEFPGQTHIWIWREITHLYEWGIQIEIFSTKYPSPHIKAKHDFADTAQTYYLWKQNIFHNIIDIFVSLCWSLTHPIGLFKAIKLALTINVEAPRWHIIALVPMACILARCCVARSIEHMHCHSCGNSAILAIMLKQITGISYSLTLNANLEWWGGGMTAKFTNAAFIIAITKKLEAEVRRNYPVQENQVLLGRIGVDTAKWNRQLYKLNNNNNLTFQILTVGRLHTSKGHDTLIQSVKCLVDAGKLVHLTIVGAGLELDNLKALAAKLEISNSIEFTGTLSENQIIEKMCRVDAFVLASHCEPLGVVYMEAMAMSVATIGTNSGGVPEIITDGQDGLLVAPRDVTALASALMRLIENPALKTQLGRSGRSTIIEHFDSRIGAATLKTQIISQINSGV